VTIKRVRCIIGSLFRVFLLLHQKSLNEKYVMRWKIEQEKQKK
jgi:hypothetical protein